MKKTRKEIIRAVSFLLAVCTALWLLSIPFTVNIWQSKVTVQGVTSQPDDTLEAVYIGNSGVYRFWQSALAYQEYGITVMNFATASMPGIATEYLMEQTRKNQNVDLFIVDLRAYTDSELDGANLHNIIDYFPLSWTRFKLVTRLCLYQKYWPFEALEYYFPVLRFHSRWDELTKDDFTAAVDTTKGSYYYSDFIQTVQTEHDTFLTTENRTEPQKRAQKALNGLLDYCDENNIKVLFVAAPLLEHENQKERLNWFCDMVEARGYQAINFNSEPTYDAVGLDVSTDFMDNTHTNVYGSIKFTDWLGSYLVENYGLDDRSGLTGYESWNDAYAIYSQKIGNKPTMYFEQLAGLTD